MSLQTKLDCWWRWEELWENTVKMHVTILQVLSSRRPRTSSNYRGLIWRQGASGISSLFLDRENEAQRESNLPRVTRQSPASASKQRGMMLRTRIKEPPGPQPARGGMMAWRQDPHSCPRGSLTPKEPPTWSQALNPCLPRKKTVPQPFRAAEVAPGAPWRHSHLLSP